nr:MAG TPA: hypothetical protein [Caudoviricetes sp.]DAT04410.1 MAG TPA: hypothetical protein [Caudoviricetes sp.]
MHLISMLPPPFCNKKKTAFKLSCPYINQGSNNKYSTHTLSS